MGGIGQTVRKGVGRRRFGWTADPTTTGGGCIVGDKKRSLKPRKWELSLIPRQGLTQRIRFFVA